MQTEGDIAEQTHESQEPQEHGPPAPLEGFVLNPLPSPFCLLGWLLCGNKETYPRGGSHLGAFWVKNPGTLQIEVFS